MSEEWKSADEMLKLAEESQQVNNEVKLIVSEILKAVESAARKGEMFLAFREHGFGNATLRNHRNLSFTQIRVIEKLRELGYVADIEVWEMSIQELRSESQGESKNVFLQVQWGELNEIDLAPRIKLYSSLQKFPGI